jgi:hypothetical protein
MPRRSGERRPATPVVRAARGAVAVGVGAAVALALAGGSPGRAAASPLVDPYLGGVVFTGPAHGHTTSIYYNPAALGLQGGNHFYIAGTLRLDQVDIERAPIDPATGEPGGSADAGATDTAELTPGWFAGFATDFNGSRATLGIATYTPVAERFVAGQDAVRYHTLGGHSYEWFTTIGFAYRLSSRVVIGFAPSLVFSDLELSFARDTALEQGTPGLESACGDAACGAENPDAQETYDVESRSLLNLSLNLGVVVEVRPGWNVGLGFVTPTGAFDRLSVPTRGSVVMQAAPRDGGGTFRGDAAVTYRAPWQANLGGRAELPVGVDVVLGARWLGLGRQEQYDVRMYGGDLAAGGAPEWYPRYRGLSDVFVFEAGAEGQEQAPVRLGGRLRFETGAVEPDALSPMQIAGVNLQLATGAELRLGDRLAVVLGYAIAWYPSHSVADSAFDPRARIDCVASDYSLDVCAPAREGRAIPTAAGDYSRLLHGFTAALRFDSL